MSSGIGDLLARAEELIARAEQGGVPLRMVGSLAYRVHCPRHVQKLDELGRETPHDLDFVAPRKAFRPIRETFVGCGFVMDEQVAIASDRSQLYFEDPASSLGADVYLGRLNYCHPIDFQDRLERDRPTVALADLLLTKLQITELTDKDIKDMSVLLLEHPVGPSSPSDTVDLDRIARLLSDDWGFYHTVDINLKKMSQCLERLTGLDQHEKSVVQGRLASVRDALEVSPKTRRWRMRERVGERVKWYQTVEDKSPSQG